MPHFQYKDFKMKIAKNGRSVRVHYRGTLNDGTVFDNSRDRGETLDFELGKPGMISGFQNGIVGMRTGETKSFSIPCVDAYGEHVPEAIVKVSKDVFHPEMKLEVGAAVMGQGPQGPMRAVISAVEDDSVLLDHNHPLAGKDLSFEVELVEVSRVKE